MTQEKHYERKKSTEAAAKVPKITRANITAPLLAKQEGKKVAYCFIVCAHDEIIRAMDIVPMWTETYAGICAVKRDAARFLERAGAENFSRSLCTYATCGLGFDLLREHFGTMPENAPWGGQARPDMMLSTGQMLCDPRYKWYQAIQQYMPDVPIYANGFLWPPYEPDRDHQEVESYYVKYAVEELRGLVEFLERQTGKKMDWDNLSERVHLVDRTWDIFWKAYDLRRAVPTPMDTGDAMNTMVPLAFNLGTQEACDFYRDLYDELKYRVDNKIGVVPEGEENYRLLWAGGLPPWFALRDFEYFHSKGAVFPVERTYREAELIEHLDLPKVSDPLEHIAWRWIRYWTHWYNRARKRPGSFPEVERLIEYIEDYKIDGIVVHEAFSCRTWHPGLIWQLNVLKRVYREIPSLVLESDIVDITSYSEGDTHNRIDAFIDTLEAVKSR
jgi:benzoyl-CoA reductase/2-hydroxyglutaryl-CoA dehydratase subunit BcrC/BadD/HgdB